VASPGASFLRRVGALQTVRSALWLLRRQLVRQLWPFAFHDGPHFVRDMIDVLDIEHVLVQPFFGSRD